MLNGMGGEGSGGTAQRAPRVRLLMFINGIFRQAFAQRM